MKRVGRSLPVVVVPARRMLSEPWGVLLCLLEDVPSFNLTRGTKLWGKPGGTLNGILLFDAIHST